MEKHKIFSLIYKQHTWNRSHCKFSHTPLNRVWLWTEPFLEHLEGSTDKYTQRNTKQENRQLSWETDNYK